MENKYRIYDQCIKGDIKMVKNDQGLFKKQTLKYRYLTKEDGKNLLLAYMLDLCIMLSPMMIWNIIMLAVLGSLLSIAGIFVADIFVGIFLVFTLFILNAKIMKKTKGCTYGMYQFGFRIIQKDGKMATSKVCWKREIFGTSIPFVVLMITTNIFGLLVYWIINIVVVCIDKYHRSIIDFITKTCVVKMEEVKEEIQIVEDVKEEIVEELNTIDLRVHSNFSALGTHNVEELFQMAVRKGVKTLSITDCNSAKANAVALRMSELYHLQYIPGVELSAQYRNHKLRILAYFIDYKNELFTTIENTSLLNEKKASVERIRRFEFYLQMQIPTEQLLRNNRYQKITGRMIAYHVLSREEYVHCSILQEYRDIPLEQAIEELVKRYFEKGKPCYVEVDCPPLQDILDVVSLSNGIAVLADAACLLDEMEVLEEILDYGIEGIEVFQSSYTRADMASLLQVAQRKKLFITCGSNFYGNQKDVELGLCRCPKEAESLVNMFIDARKD